MGMHPDTIRLQKAELRIRQLEAEVRALREHCIVLDPAEAVAK